MSGIQVLLAVFALFGCISGAVLLGLWKAGLFHPDCPTASRFSIPMPPPRMIYLKKRRNKSALIIDPVYEKYGVPMFQSGYVMRIENRDLKNYGHMLIYDGEVHGFRKLNKKEIENCKNAL